MVIHVFLNHPYTRFIFVIVIASVLTFINKLNAFHTYVMYYIVMLVTSMMIFVSSTTSLFHDAYMDFGFLLLMISMLVLTYNNLMICNRV